MGAPAKGPSRRFSSLAALILAAFYLATSVFIASRRPLWFDEILTVRFSRLPDVGTIWRAILHVDPNMSYPYFLLVHAFWNLPGHPEIIARLPSALAVTAGLLITYDCVRRLTDGLHGLVAVSLLTCSFLPYYGYEARSYSLFFMLAALSLWVWCHVPDTWKSAGIFFAVFAAGMMMHFYFVLTLVPYVVFELLMLKSRRSLSRKIIGGALGIVCGAALLLPQILASRHSSASYWAPPSTTGLLETLSTIFPGGLFLLAIFMIWIAIVPAKEDARLVPPMSLAESTGWLFFLIPLAGYVLALYVTNAFLPRYFISLLPGIAVASACLLWRFCRATRRIAAGIFLLLASLGVAKQANTARHPQSIDPFGQQTQTRQIREVEKAVWKDGKQFLLCTNTLLHMEAHYYSPRAAQYGFLIESDEERSHMTVKITIAMAQFYPAHIWTLEDLRQHAREAAVEEPGDATLKAMEAAGYRPVIRFSQPLQVAYFE